MTVGIMILLLNSGAKSMQVHFLPTEKLLFIQKANTYGPT